MTKIRMSRALAPATEKRCEQLREIAKRFERMGCWDDVCLFPAIAGDRVLVITAFDGWEVAMEIDLNSMHVQCRAMHERTSIRMEHDTNLGHEDGWTEARCFLHVIQSLSSAAVAQA